MCGVISLNPGSSSGPALMQIWIIDRSCSAEYHQNVRLGQLLIRMGKEKSKPTRLKGRVELRQRFLRSIMQGITKHQRGAAQYMIPAKIPTHFLTTFSVSLLFSSSASKLKLSSGLESSSTSPVLLVLDRLPRIADPVSTFEGSGSESESA